MLRAIGWYQRAFAWKPSPCRFYPSCSNYAIEAIETHGAKAGLGLTLKRLSRCRPFGSSGIDLVPEVGEHSSRRHRPTPTAPPTLTSTPAPRPTRVGPPSEPLEGN